jgi:heparan-alpha-glucosaminide N-acetyltransferase
MKQLPKRLLSIDVLRAVTMLLMIFINDASGVSHVPAWMDHAKEYEDGMGFADCIFPAFLFIVGLSLPFAIKNRLNKGDSFWEVSFYILSRSAALLIMGFYHVNMESYNSAAAVLSDAVWELIVTLCFFLVWLDYPDTLAKAKKYSLIGLGLVVLIIMAILYKGGGDGGHAAHGMRPSWWGILGIIGWSYIVCAFVYLIFKGKLGMMFVFFLIFAGINIASHTGLIHGNIWVIGDASSVTLTMGGIVISGIYTYLVSVDKTQRIWLIFTTLGILFIVLGLLIRPYTEGISKIRSTPAWVFICSGITILGFELAIYLVDVKGKINYFKAIRPAGTSTLTCYLIPYIQISLYTILHVSYFNWMSTGIPGMCFSMLTAFIIVWIVGRMEKRRLRLKV